MRLGLLCGNGRFCLGVREKRKEKREKRKEYRGVGFWGCCFVSRKGAKFLSVIALLFFFATDYTDFY